MPTVAGRCDPRFQGVRDAFVENFDRFGELGAALTVVVDGHHVVDLWGGYADAARTCRWERDTIVPVASTTKGVTTLCAHMLVDRGLLDLDEPVATYWPEFAQQGKERVLVRHVLSHQAGLVTTDPPLSIEDYMDAGRVLRALERTRAQWEPGTMYAYHALTFGFLVAELVRRITGCSIGSFVRDEIAGPIGVDFYIGFGPEIDSRVAEFVVELPLIDFVSAPRGMLTAGSANLLGCTRASRAIEQPSGNGHGTARALASIYGALARGGEIGGVRLLEPQTVAQSAIEQVAEPWGEAPSSSTNVRWALGWMSNSTLHMGPNPRSFGNMGGGGSLAFADPDACLGFAHIMNKYREPTRFDPRRAPLVDAIYEAL